MSKPKITLVTHGAHGIRTIVVTYDDLMARLGEQIAGTHADHIIVTVAPAMMMADSTLTTEQIALLTSRIEDCAEFLTRTKNCLRNTGHEFVATLPFVMEDELWRISNMGKKSIKNTTDFLESWGIGRTAQHKIDRHITETFGIDPEKLKTLRRRLQTLGFSKEENETLAWCALNTLAGLVCRSEEEIRILLKQHQRYYTSCLDRRGDYDLEVFIQKLRVIAEHHGFTFASPELQALRPWICW